MTPADFRAIRLRLGLTLVEWGEALGYEGATTRHTMAHIEAGTKPLTERTARLARMYEKHGIPKEFRPKK